MKTRTSYFTYLLLLIYSYPFLHSSQQKKREPIKLKVMVNKLLEVQDKVGVKKQKPNYIVIDLLPSDTYGDLESKIVNKSYRLPIRKVTSRRVDIFRSPPSGYNKLKTYYYEAESITAGQQEPLMVDTNIKDGNLLYAIVHHKDSNVNKTKTIFVDYQYSSQIIMLRIPSAVSIKEQDILVVARSSFKEVLKDGNLNSKNEQGLKELDKANQFIYPDHLEALAKKTKRLAMHEYLENGDRISLRVDPPKPITLTIKLLYKQGDAVVVDETKTKKIEGVFTSNSYVSDVIHYVKKKLRWPIYSQLMLKGSPTSNDYGALILDWRLERYAYFSNDNLVCYVGRNDGLGKLDYIKKLQEYIRKLEESIPENAVTDQKVTGSRGNTQKEKHDYTIKLRNYMKELERKYFLNLIINKRATSDITNSQNKQLIPLMDFKLGNATIKDLKAEIKVALNKEKTTSAVTHRYTWNLHMNKRLKLYCLNASQELRPISTEKDGKKLKEAGIKPGDTVFAIIASNKNPYQISFFIKDQINGKVVLITENIPKLGQNNQVLLAENKLASIREKALKALYPLEMHDTGLPVGDCDIVDKTEIVLIGEGKPVWALQNGDIIGIKLKENYVIVSLQVDGDPFTLLRIAVLEDSNIGDILKEAKRQKGLNGEDLEDALFLKDGNSLVKIDPTASLKNTSTNAGSFFYMKQRKDPENNVKSNEKDNVEQGSSKPSEVEKTKQNEYKELDSVFLSSINQNKMPDNGDQNIGVVTDQQLANNNDAGTSVNVSEDINNHLDDNVNNVNLRENVPLNTHLDVSDHVSNNNANQKSSDKNGDSNDDDVSKDNFDQESSDDNENSDSNDDGTTQDDSDNDGDFLKVTTDSEVNNEVITRKDTMDSIGEDKKGDLPNIAAGGTDTTSKPMPANKEPDSKLPANNEKRTSVVSTLGVLGALGVAGTLAVVTWGSDANKWLKSKMGAHNKKSEE